MENYYTYAYLRENKTPYYIGKGKCKTQRHLHPGHYVPVPPKERILILFLNKTHLHTHHTFNRHTFATP